MDESSTTKETCLDKAPTLTADKKRYEEPRIDEIGSLDDFTRQVNISITVN